MLLKPLIVLLSSSLCLDRSRFLNGCDWPSVLKESFNQNSLKMRFNKQKPFYGFHSQFQNSVTFNVFFSSTKFFFIIAVLAVVVALVTKLIRLLTQHWPFKFCCFPDNSTESDRRDLLRELETMKQLKPHPHVIKLLGCVTESGKLFKDWNAHERIWTLVLCPV